VRGIRPGPMANPHPGPLPGGEGGEKKGIVRSKETIGKPCG